MLLPSCLYFSASALCASVGSGNVSCTCACSWTTTSRKMSRSVLDTRRLSLERSSMLTPYAVSRHWTATSTLSFASELKSAVWSCCLRNCTMESTSLFTCDIVYLCSWSKHRNSLFI
uniref:Putative secreted protein n=1 Tax=Ixodes ricinus TaxID=34613 RepID=A0A6B0UMF5_IXORI